VPGSLRTGNYYVNGSDDIPVLDVLAEAGRDDGTFQTCLDVNTARLLTLSVSVIRQAGRILVIDPALISLACAQFAGCRLIYNRDSTFGFVPAADITAAGNVTIAWPYRILRANGATSSASWTFDCPVSACTSLPLRARKAHPHTRHPAGCCNARVMRSSRRRRRRRHPHHPRQRRRR
jgi:hypothetical protein